MTTQKDFPIPARLNMALAAGLVLGACTLLWLASHLDPVWTLPIGILFSFLLLSNYALLHEGTHDILHPNRNINDATGMVLGWLFPISFTLLKVTHTVHHCCNRTDHEMFDCYYPGDNRVVKFFQWYGLMLGIWWYLIPVGSLLLALVPRWLHTPPFKQARSTAVLFDDFGPVEIRRVRIETVLGIAFWATAFYGLSLRWEAVLIAYACFAFNWSTRQYVTHAFTPRNVRDGALNLRVSRPMGWLLLNGQWDRVHHQHPHIPWRHLPKLGGPEGYDTGYWRHYLRLWGGPKPCREPAPAILSRYRYRQMQ
jgi:fatty acid desaturase